MYVLGGIIFDCQSGNLSLVTTGGPTILAWAIFYCFEMKHAYVWATFYFNVTSMFTHWPINYLHFHFKENRYCIVSTQFFTTQEWCDWLAKHLTWTCSIFLAAEKLFWSLYRCLYLSLFPFKFGCCPMENAVCCTDGIHCCPEGSKCDLEKQTCLHENVSSNFSGQSYTKASTIVNYDSRVVLSRKLLIFTTLES